MSGFQFGATSTTSTPFNAPTANQNTSFNFKAPAFGTPTTAASFGAGNVGLSFGAPASAANTGLNFGTPASAANTGLSFGTPASTASVFGTANPSGGLFGTPQTSVAPAATGLFGGSASTAPATGLFGTPAVAAAAPPPSTGLFGAPASSAPATGLFGTPTATAPGSNLFGTPTQAAPATNLFATPASTAPTMGLFGSPASSTPSAGLFGAAPPAQTSNAPGFSFGATTAAPRLGAFATSTSAAAIQPNLSFGATPAATIPGFNFGTSTISTSANQTIPSTGLSFGLGGSSFNLTPKQPAQANIGLGGIAPIQPKSITTSGKTELVPKEQMLPNELQQTVQNFKEFVKKQKSYSSDVARFSIKEFKKVESEIDSAGNLLNDVEKQLQNNRAVAEKLKHDTVKVLQNVEIAQRTYDTPPGLQYDNTSPLIFFTDLADTFEKEMYALKLQIDNTDKYVKNLGKQTPLSSQDLTNGMRKLHETFVALAGRLQSIHSEVETHKEQYLNLRKYMFHDETNVFERSLPQNEILSLENINKLPSKVAVAGPTPFNSFMNSSVVQQIQAQNPPPPYAGSNQIGLKTTPTASFGVQPPTTTTLLFGNTSNFGQSGFLFNSPNTSNTFQLQRPPAGGKRKQ